MPYQFTLVPRDVLFMRDARPMEASDAGLGANWPRPDQLYNAIHHAFLNQWKERQPWEGLEHTRNLPSDKNQDSTFRFGSLKTAGPFPRKGNALFLPCPLDVGMDLRRVEGTNLPFPLTHAFLPRSHEKESNPQWIPEAEFKKYLNGSPVSLEETRLYGTDRSVCTAIDPVTGTVIDGRLYQAEFLRLKDDVSMAFEAECILKPKGMDGEVDVFAQPEYPKRLIMGGQQGVCTIFKDDRPWFSFPEVEITAKWLRWTLLTPAVFTDGWLPGWCKDSRRISDAEKKPIGTVMLNGPFTAKLIAARIGKPVVFSGWDLKANRPKPTILAVPAGSSYVFECEDVSEAKALAKELNYPKRRSGCFGEKGFGIGICSSITVQE